jgi:hypothetical protein
VALPFGAIHSASSVNSAAMRIESHTETIFQALRTVSFGLVTPGSKTGIAGGLASRAAF